MVSGKHTLKWQHFVLEMRNSLAVVWKLHLMLIRGVEVLRSVNSQDLVSMPQSMFCAMGKGALFDSLRIKCLVWDTFCRLWFFRISNGMILFLSYTDSTVELICQWRTYIQEGIGFATLWLKLQLISRVWMEHSGTYINPLSHDDFHLSVLWLQKMCRHLLSGPWQLIPGGSLAK